MIERWKNKTDRRSTSTTEARMRATERASRPQLEAAIKAINAIVPDPAADRWVEMIQQIPPCTERVEAMVEWAIEQAALVPRGETVRRAQLRALAEALDKWVAAEREIEGRSNPRA